MSRIGWAVCGSFCTLAGILPVIEQLVSAGHEVTPILSEAVRDTDTRFIRAEAFRATIECTCGHRAIDSLVTAEPIGPRKLFDAIVVAPCTGNTLAKLANGISDGTVTLACKAHLRNGRPLIIAVSTNDALAANATNLGQLLARRHVYFVPLGQDDPPEKPCSCVADFTKIPETINDALRGEQAQPLLV
ncbi:MAG: dipicolinate synthase subunit B [Oscillospiraceae bacterium]|nr:dipicolinate synthase subunit B [Oscillospiraceae bacterium]